MSHTNQNYFELLSLPVGFHIDRKLLETNSQSLLSEWHPDRFVNGEDIEKKQAAQMTSLINEAKSTLASRLSRAGYLLKLQNQDPETHRQEDMDSVFLFQQMSLRDAVEQAEKDENEESLLKLKAEVKNELEEVYQAFEKAWQSSEPETCRKIFHQLQFIEKLLTEIKQSEERLLDY